MADPRYSCQVKLPKFGGARQSKLQKSKVLVVGAGGLGCPASLYLAAAGIGKIEIVDFDKIEISNLHRQILFSEEDVGKYKCKIVAKALQKQNPNIDISAKVKKVTSKNVESIIKGFDVVVDCTDNYDARYILNFGCVRQNIPVVYGAAYQYEGQVAVWNTKNLDGSRSPNYLDIFPRAENAIIADCATGGVLPTLTGIIGCMQANEVIKYITGVGNLLKSKLLILDGLTLQSKIINLPKKSFRTPDDTAVEEKESLLISVKELEANIDNYQLIDVRSASERARFNIGGLNIPLENIFDDVGLVSTVKPVVIYCETGGRSLVATKYFNQRTSMNALSLEGGMAKWQKIINN